MPTYPTDFSRWRLQQLEQVFGLKNVKKMPELSSWTDNPAKVSEKDQQNLIDLLEFSDSRLMYWNEAALKWKFLSQVIFAAHLDTEFYATYPEIKLSARLQTVDNQILKLSGVADLILAKGRLEPELPYFCLHEYKKVKGFDSDPLAQTLAAMLVAQELNQKVSSIHPIYGCYTIGLSWFFLALSEKNYAISKPYTFADKENLIEIVGILSNLNEITKKILNQEN